MIKHTLCAGWLALSLASPLLAQAGDPSFPKETPPADPKSPPPDKKSPAPADKKKQPVPRAPKEETPDPAPGIGGQIDLRPRFRLGDQTRYVMRIKSDNQVDIEGLVPSLTPDRGDKKEAGKQHMEQEIAFSLRVTSVSPEEGATVELVQERIKISLEHDGSNISYDSSAPKKPNDDSDLIEPYVKGLAGSKMTIRFDAAGNIKDIQGGPQPMPGGLPAGIPGDAKSLGSLFGPIATDSAGRGLYRVGETWTNSDKIDTGLIGSFRMLTKHTLRSARAGNAEVHFNGRIEPGSEGGKPDSPFQVKDSRYQGKYVWDTERGQLKSMQSDQEIEIAAGQGKQGGMKANTTVSVERQGR